MSDVTGHNLDAGARIALDVALGTAGAAGDERCGTEHLLFGIIATARGELAELAEIFALDTMRLERAIQALRSHHCSVLHDGPGDPPLSPRAEVALGAPSMAGNERRSAFDVLVATLDDHRSGAATVLRHLGVRPSDVRRLAEVGAASLGRNEVEGMIAALDRRQIEHRPWWGPEAEGPVAQVPLSGSGRIEIARSRSATVAVDGLVTSTDGFGFTITVASRNEWLLPPVWEPAEHLVPGDGSRHRMEPDVVVVELRYADGTVLSNRRPDTRWSAAAQGPRLVHLGTRISIDRRNDRRVPERRVETADWWAWPIPADGEVTLQLWWPAESVSGALKMDLTPLIRHAERLRSKA